MKWGGDGRAVAGVVIVALVGALLVLLALSDDPRETAMALWQWMRFPFEVAQALWRWVRFPFGFVLGGLALATVLDR